MVRLREIQRTAAFAWSPGPGKPLLVTGTRAGAVDADFSDETKLELWDLNLDSEGQGLELEPVASITTDSRCDLFSLCRAWASPLLTDRDPKVLRYRLGTPRRRPPTGRYRWSFGEWLP